MLAAGVTGFRLNTSHLSLPQLEAWVERLGAFLATQDPPPPLVLDLQGSKWRLGQFPACELTEGQRVTLICAASTDRPNELPVPHPDFFRAPPCPVARSCSTMPSCGCGSKRRMRRLHARVTTGGPIFPRKGITYTGSTHRQESLSDTDRGILTHTQHLPGIRYALSYVKDAMEMANYRAQIGRSAYLIAKLERRPAMDEAMQIAATADEVWLCRGDLGAELGATAMAASVYHFSERVDAMPVPVLLAGQVFEHMVEHPTPTRSEVCAAHDALRKGYQGFVLSDETAIGHDPVESCRAAALFRR